MLRNWYLQRKLQEITSHSHGSFHIPSITSLTALAEIKAIVFPSTAFFYAGSPQLAQFFAFQDQTMDMKQHVLQLAAGMAVTNRTDSFRAIAQAAQTMNLVVREMEVDQISPLGLVGKLDRTWYILGDEACMNQEGLELGMSVVKLVKQFQQEGKYTLLLAQKQPKRLLGIFACYYPLHDEAVGVISTLADEGIASILLTQLKRGIAQSVAQQLGISQLQSELDPETKKLALHGVLLQEPRTAIVQRSLDDIGGFNLILPNGEMAWFKSLVELTELRIRAKNVVNKRRSNLF